MRNMTIEEFSRIVDAVEAGVPPPDASEIAAHKKSNGMSKELVAFLDGLADEANMEAAIQAIMFTLK